MSFMKKFVGKISETLNIASNAIKDIIKENNQSLDKEIELAKESKEGIATLKTYAEAETPGLAAAITTLADTFEKIGTFREEKGPFMTTESIVAKVWSFCNTLRDDGVSYGDYLEQLTYLLFLKMADEYSKPPYNRGLPIPKKYNWESLTDKRGA